LGELENSAKNLKLILPRDRMQVRGEPQRYGNGDRSEEEAMTINDLPAVMGTVLIVAGLALVGIYTRFRTEGSEKSVQAGALLIVVGAVLLGLSLFVPHAK
jgi:hypothetical protein